MYPNKGISQGPKGSSTDLSLEKGWARGLDVEGGSQQAPGRIIPSSLQASAVPSGLNLTLHISLLFFSAHLMSFSFSEQSHYLYYVHADTFPTLLC